MSCGRGRQTHYLPPQKRSLSGALSRPFERSSATRPLPTRTREVYAHYSQDRETCVLFRTDQSILAKLRSGLYMGLRAHRVDRVSDLTCNICGQANQTMDHWLGSCLATQARRAATGCLVRTLVTWVAWPSTHSKAYPCLSECDEIPPRRQLNQQQQSRNIK